MKNILSTILAFAFLIAGSLALYYIDPLIPAILVGIGCVIAFMLLIAYAIFYEEKFGLVNWRKNLKVDMNVTVEFANTIKNATIVWIFNERIQVKLENGRYIETTPEELYPINYFERQ